MKTAHFKFLCFTFFVLIFTSLAVAEPLVLMGQTVEVENVRRTNKEVASADLKEGVSLKVGNNTLPHVPKGTALYVFKEKGVYKVKGLLIKSNLSEFAWTLSNGEVIALKCSLLASNGTEAHSRYISFWNAESYGSGCSTETDVKIKTSLGGAVSVQPGQLELDADGSLIYAEHARGSLKLNGSKLKLADGKALRFYTNTSALQFFYMAEGESFSYETSLGKEVRFVQKAGEPILPVKFYNISYDEEEKKTPQQLEEAFVDLGGFESVAIDFKVFSRLKTALIVGGPVGFDKQGQIDKFVSASEVEIDLFSGEKVYLMDPQTREETEVPIQMDMKTVLPLGSHVFLHYEEGESKAKLLGYPVLLEGKRYILTFKATQQAPR